MTGDDWAAVAAIAQAATVLVAGWALIYARGQVQEARETRERVAQPNVVVYVDLHQVRRYMDLVIKNFGQTTAYNVRLTLPPLQVVPYTSHLAGGEVTSLYVPDNIAVLAPGQEWRTLWDSAVRRENYKGTLQNQFVGHVDFDDKMIADKPSFRNPISLDIKMFWSTMWVERSQNKAVESALSDIADTLRGYKDDDEGIWIYTAGADDERSRRERQRQARDADNERFLRDIGAVIDTTEGPEEE
ncbi:hypothetical protein ACQ86B_17395 [Mycolicibacterium aichiense]|uniref:hypothetical protein n=1 Tax=Mycolicibacterium aichiense TaxID=1799 RepID=UPI003D677A9C